MVLQEKIKYPILSILMPVRIRTDLDNAKHRNIFKFFKSATESIFPEDRNKVEFLLKFDKDDSVAMDLVFKKENLKRYPLSIKYFFYNRWEGLLSSHEIYTFLFRKRNPNSKFISFTSDDTILRDFSKHILARLEQRVDDNYLILGYGQHLHTAKKLEEVKDYKNTQKIWYTPNYVIAYPFVSSKIIEICSILGYHRNTDGWLSLLNIILYANHGINLCKDLDYLPYLRMNTPHSEVNWNEKPFPSDYGFDIAGGETEKNSIFFTLVEQQAKNIYLNIKEEGLLEKYKI